MPQPTIGFNVFVALEVFSHLSAQIAFHEDHAIVRAGLFRTHLGCLDGLSDGGQFVLAQSVGAGSRINLGVFQHLGGSCRADTIEGPERYVDSLIGGYIDS